ncbi:MAG: UDP-N-acetylmuramoyl-L-alanyl-D-glutamate--2,6-diaminopimelate ligase [Desulfovibrionaceae bacterium]|nr:UDP-N-acetylmuramoyl-L-alanyl-D-glutamate--2,6-diaminopimelate ligase [Desulfovibrionaceae bacterium]
MTYEKLRDLVRAGLAVTGDSRQVAPGGAFVVVHGASEDGLRYVPDALAKGAAYLVLEEDCVGQCAEAAKAAGAALVRHSDTRLALSELASDCYHTYETPLKVIGVTGTNGKTTCASLLERLFEAAGHRVGVMGTVNYRWPGHLEASPLTTPGPMDVHRMLAEMAKAGCDICVMEVSSHSLEQKRVRHVPFAGACFTNLTQDHLDFHVTMEAYFEAKALLFTETPLPGKAVATNADDPWALRLLDIRPDAWTYGFGPAPAKGDPMRHLRGELLEHGTSGVGLRLTCQGRTWELHSPLIGRFNADNLLTVMAMGLAMGMTDFRALEGFAGVPGRLERVANPKGVHVFVDYAHTPDALVNVLQALRGAGFKRIVTVFGCGGNRDRKKRPLMGEAVAKLSDVAVLTSDNPRFEEPEDIIADVMPGLAQAREVVVDADRRSATEKALALLGPEDCLLIAGKGHEDYQIVKGVKRHYSDQETVRELLGA